MFRAIKDTNSGVVYDWVKILEDGSEVFVNVPTAQWKTQQEWSVEEVAALFDGVAVVTVEPVQEPEATTPGESESFL
jgi:hypothetical protein